MCTFYIGYISRWEFIANNHFKRNLLELLEQQNCIRRYLNRLWEIIQNFIFISRLVLYNMLYDNGNEILLQIESYYKNWILRWIVILVMYGVTEAREYMVSMDGSSCFIVQFIHKKPYLFIILKRYMISLNKRKNTNNKNQHSWIYCCFVSIPLYYIYVSYSMRVLVCALIILNKFRTIENVVIFPIKIFHYKP